MCAAPLCVATARSPIARAQVVTLAEAVPCPGSGIKLPLDLHYIASRCTNSYYAPRRFAAVQLAFSAPRARILVFHTGRVVGTGCSGQMEARLSILRAQRQLAVEAGMKLHIRAFQVINQVRSHINPSVIVSGPQRSTGLKITPRQVAAVALDARLNCDEFATKHSATSHYDRQSFVGLAWRPVGEPICCEIYSTGALELEFS
jgi:TATA-box binding protein (TBP) (component of TFIID and TFIIIB)